jgi:hypothetical protein
MVYGAPRRKRLADAGGCLGRYRAPSAGVQTVSSVAAGFGRDTCGFRWGAVGFRSGSVECELEGAGRRWRRVASTLSCRGWCRAGLDRAQTHGNVTHALCVLGGTVAPCGHGRGAVNGGFEVTASSGIDHACAEEFDGEVIGPGVVGGVLALLGCPRRAWRWQGGVGWLGPVSDKRGQF